MRVEQTADGLAFITLEEGERVFVQFRNFSTRPSVYVDTSWDERRGKHMMHVSKYVKREKGLEEIFSAPLSSIQ